jgi:fucokinase
VLELSDEFIDLINNRLLLVYTGLTRLAKDLLINVIRNWYSISDVIYDNVQELIKNGNKCKNALKNGNNLLNICYLSSN